MVMRRRRKMMRTHKNNRMVMWRRKRKMMRTHWDPIGLFVDPSELDSANGMVMWRKRRTMRSHWDNSCSALFSIFGAALSAADQCYAWG